MGERSATSELHILCCTTWTIIVKIFPQQFGENAVEQETSSMFVPEGTKRTFLFLNLFFTLLFICLVWENKIFFSAQKRAPSSLKLRRDK